MILVGACDAAPDDHPLFDELLPWKRITLMISAGALDPPDDHPPEPPSMLIILTIFGDDDDGLLSELKKVACATAKQTARTMNTFTKINIENHNLIIWLFSHKKNISKKKTV